MKKSYKLALAVTASAALGLAIASAYAHPGGFGGGMGPGMMQGMTGGMGPWAGTAGPGARLALVTPEERTAFAAQMRAAKTPEERQQFATARHTEMQKRFQQTGVTLPQRRAPSAGFGPDLGSGTE